MRSLRIDIRTEPAHGYRLVGMREGFRLRQVLARVWLRNVPCATVSLAAVHQDPSWWATNGGGPSRIGRCLIGFGSVFEMIQDPLHDRRVFEAGDHFGPVLADSGCRWPRHESLLSDGDRM